MRPNEDTPPCDICGKSVEVGPEKGGCDCPECPVCHVVGDPSCYRRHGLKSKSDGQT